MSGSIFDAFGNSAMSPGIMGLLGMAQGFGAAAMPQPYKGGTPFGAALGMAAGGFGQGVQNAYKTQIAQQEAIGAGLQNQQLKAYLGLLPAALGQGVGQQPAQQQPSTGIAPPVAPMSSPGSSGDPLKMALASITDPKARAMAVNAATASGLPPAAWPAWIAAVHNESGWNLNAPDNKNTNGTIDVGPGQINSGTWPTLKMTEDQARDPQVNLMGSAKYFAQKWNEAKGDPIAAGVGYNTGTVAGSVPDYSSRMRKRLGAFGIPGFADNTSATVTVPTSSQTQGMQPVQMDDTARASVRQLIGMRNLAMAAPKGTGMRTVAQIQAQLDNIAGPGGIVDPLTGNVYSVPGALAQRTAASQATEQGKVGPALQEAAGKGNIAIQVAGGEANARLPAALAEKGFRVGTDGNLAPIPGGLADPAYVGGKIAAESAAAVPAKLAELGYQQGKDGTYSPILGGPADPTHIGQKVAASEEAKVGPETKLAANKAAISVQEAGGKKAAEAPYEPPVVVNTPDGPVTYPRSALPGLGGGAPGAAPAPIKGMTPDTEKELQTEGERLGQLPKEILPAAQQSAKAIYRIDQARQAVTSASAEGIPPGKFSPVLAQAVAAAKSLGVNTSAVNISPKAVSDAQVAHEALIQLSGEMLKSLFPQRVTNQDVNLFAPALASFEMDPAALDKVLNIFKTQAQYDVDRSNSMLGYQKQHGTLKGWEPEFYKEHGYGPQLVGNQAVPEGGKGTATTEGAAVQYREGQTATNPKTKERVVFRNGQWVPQ